MLALEWHVQLDRSKLARAKAQARSPAHTAHKRQSGRIMALAFRPKSLELVELVPFHMTAVPAGMAGE